MKWNLWIGGIFLFIWVGGSFAQNYSAPPDTFPAENWSLNSVLAFISKWPVETIEKFYKEGRFPIWNRDGREMIFNQAGEYVGLWYQACRFKPYGSELERCFQEAIHSVRYPYTDTRTKIRYNDAGFDMSGVYRRSSGDYAECYGFSGDMAKWCMQQADRRLTWERAEAARRREIFCRQGHSCDGNATWSYQDCTCVCMNGGSYPNCHPEPRDHDRH